MRKPRAKKPPAAKRVALACAKAAEGKQAGGIVILDMREISSIADYFVICGGSSDRQVKAIADGVIDELSASGARCFHSEGWRDCSWVVLDFADVIVHVFQEEARERFQIERLWGDAKKVPKRQAS
ncbi:MAG: ribosome silencing factor [Chlamydiota bacterium]